MSVSPSAAAARPVSAPSTVSPRTRPSSGSRTASTVSSGKCPHPRGLQEGKLRGCVYDESIKKWSEKEAGVLENHYRSALKYGFSTTA